MLWVGWFRPRRAEVATEELPRLVADRTIVDTTRIWVPGLAEWEEWQDCQDIFELPARGPAQTRASCPSASTSSRLCGESLCEDQIVVTNDSAPSSAHRPGSPTRAGRDREDEAEWAEMMESVKVRRRRNFLCLRASLFLFKLRFV